MNGTQSTYYNLVMKYRPLLVLSPEISGGSKRSNHYDKDWRKNKKPHVNQDYHPRDIGLVLDNAWLPGKLLAKVKKPNREKLLEEMSKNKISHIRVTKYKVKDCAKYWEKYAQEAHKKGINGDGSDLYPRKAYARVVNGEGRYKDYVSIQYWLPYFYDDWANVHQMDWEMVSVILKNEEPYACVFNAHHYSKPELWENVDKVDDEKQKCEDGLHPVAYVANGSHASYVSADPSVRSTITDSLSGGLQDAVRASKITQRLLTDFVSSFDDGNKQFPEIDVIPDPDKWIKEWSWLNFTGNWGTVPKTNFIVVGIKVVWHYVKVILKKEEDYLPIEQPGPSGPVTKKRWKEPFDGIN